MAPVYPATGSAAGFRPRDFGVPSAATRPPRLPARTEAPLVLVAASVAARVAEGDLRAALAALTPLVLIVPDLDRAAPVPDLAARLRRQLGLE
jgi:hypothetical protein